MKNLLFIIITVCAFSTWFVQGNQINKQAISSTPTEDSNSKRKTVKPRLSEEDRFTGLDLTRLPDISVVTNLLESEQQVGATCRAVPTCPDCTGGGNVCFGVEEFYPGVTAFVGRRNIIAKCKQANALDYCGGSRGCMKKSREEQQRHKDAYGGGCYRQCEKVAGCFLNNR